jgi:phosphocarrier protein FPr
MIVQRKLVVGVRDGLHARPATQFVKLARSFSAAIEVEREGRRADAKSPVRLMLLGVKEQDEITLHIDGEDADAALQCLAAFVADTEAGTEPPVAKSAAAAEAAPKTEPAEPAPASAPAGEARGVAASEGTALGPAFPFFPENITPPPPGPVNVAQETARHRDALEATRSRLAARKAQGGAESEAIVDALMELAADPDFVEGAARHIAAGLDAVTATLRAGGEIEQRFDAMADPLLRARAEDMRSVTRNVALALLGRTEASLAEVPPGAVVVADDLGAWELSTANLAALGGLLCRAGTPLSHVSIMARSFGVPAVVGFAAPLDRLRAARVIGLDGRSGDVWLDPDADTSTRLAARIAQEAAEKADLARFRAVAPATRAGQPILVAANIGGLKDVDAALAAGAQGVGLFRTEFLFMERRALPTEDEQAAIYARVLQAFAPHAVVVRTLDVGGDKPVAGIAFPHEENPFLGWRGVRMCLERPDVFKPQLRALLRAAVHGTLRVMVPMVADIGEIRAVRALVSDCAAELSAEGAAHGEFELGIMIETPAAAVMAPELAREVAFFSIGTNDLTQYVMAADRLNPKVAALNRADHPAVLRVMQGVCRDAAAAGIPVAVCGEAASRPDLIAALVAMGVTELSMSPAAIPRAKKCVSEI